MIPTSTPTAPDSVLAIDFGGTKVAVAVADLKGRILEQTELPTEASAGGEAVVRRTLAVARALIAHQVEMRGGECVAVGAVSPGIVLVDRVLLAPNLPGWEKVSLPDLLRNGLRVEHVMVGTDVKWAAVAEAKWGSLRNSDPAVFISFGTGMGAAVVIGGRVRSGAHGAAGEIGYNLRGIQDERGIAAGHAPLEEFAGGRAIGERGSSVLGGSLSAADVFASTDARARSIVDEALAELSVHVANIAILVDPERIAVGGGLMSSADRILGHLSRRLRMAVPFPPEIVPARFIHDGALRGAVVLALKAAAASRASSLTASETSELAK
ncbi:MAG TPA: ROK family protein [Candidatus Dormibacteraeota bacterium]|jgi:glucokinase